MGFVFVVCKQKPWISPADRLSSHPSLFKVSQQLSLSDHPQDEQLIHHSLPPALKMLLSSVLTSPKVLLQLCISTIHCVFASVFSKVCFWTKGGCREKDSRFAAVDGKLEQSDGDQSATTPTSVNYHFTRKCNYKCGFCFHTAKTSFVLPLEEAKRGLTLLKEAGKTQISGN